MKAKFMMVGLALVTPLSVQSQDSRASLVPIPQIAVAAQHEVKVSPDRATIQISVQTRAATAAAAATQNATKLQAVLAALRAVGLTNDQLSTVNYNVHPDYVHREGKEPQITGYNVTNTIVADIRQLSQVGRVIDAALSSGANMMTSLQFYARSEERRVGREGSRRGWRL